MKANTLHWALYMLVMLLAVALGIIVAEKVLAKTEQAAAEIAG